MWKNDQNCGYMQKLVPNTLSNQFISHTIVTSNQGKHLELLEPVYKQYFTSKVKLMLKNEKSHYITNSILSHICHFIATHCHKSTTTCSHASQLIYSPVKTKHNCQN